MPTTYAGNPASYPSLITIPSDGDTRNVASVNVALEGLADRTASLNALIGASHTGFYVGSTGFAFSASISHTPGSQRSFALVPQDLISGDIVQVFYSVQEVSTQVSVRVDVSGASFTGAEQLSGTVALQSSLSGQGIGAVYVAQILNPHTSPNVYVTYGVATATYINETIIANVLRQR